MKRIFISAGEVSGDMHAASVVAAMHAMLDGIEIHGIAGPQMQQAGCHALHDMGELNVMGLGDVVKALPRIRRIERSVLSWCEQNRPDAVILVDFPGFHMRIGKKLRALGIPVIQYIAPKLWAWGAWRAKTLRQSQDRLACIFPFEQEWFGQHAINATYVGNPSAFSCQRGWSPDELKHRLGIAADTPLLALLPGSRRQELKVHVPILAESWRQIQQRLPEVHCVVPLAPGVEPKDIAPLIEAGALPLQRSQTDYALRADAAIAVSGTATLELALWGVPTLLVYRSSPVWVFLARHLVTLRCAGLANILLGDRPVMPELIQAECTTEKIVAEIMPLLRGEEPARRQQEYFDRLRHMLGEENPAEAVVTILQELAG